MTRQGPPGPEMGNLHQGIWWQAHGQGEPLVLIQGLGYSADMWYRLIDLLKEHWRVIVFDNRGIARSCGPVGELTIEQMAEDAATVIEAAGEESAHVFGVSLGGIVAQELAISHPGLVRRLVLGCTHTCDDKTVLADPEVLAMLSIRSSLDEEEAIRASVPYVYSPSTPPGLIERDIQQRMNHATNWAAYGAQLKASANYSGTWERLSNLDLPTLVIHGWDDRLVPAPNAAVIANRIPGARLTVIEGVSHNFYSEKPDTTARLLEEFLTPQDQP